MSYEENINKFFEKNDYDNLLDFLKKNKDINLNFKLKDNSFFINKLIMKNNFELIKFTLDNFNLNLDIIDNDGKNLLFYPIKNNNIKLIKFLLEVNKKTIGISILDCKDNNGFTSIFYAVIENNIEIVKLFLKNNINITDIDYDNKNVIEKAFEYKRTKIIKILIDYLNDINSLNFKGENLIQIALSYENIEIFDYLLDTNINLNNQDFENGITILHYSIILGNEDVYNKLLNKDINFTLNDKNGFSPLHYAIIEKNFKLTYYILENFTEIDFNIPNLEGNILLHSLLNYNIKVNSTNYQDDIEFKILIKLIEESNLNIPNNNNITCLHLLVEKYLWENEIIFELLKKKILNIFIKDNNNETVYDKILNKDKIIDLVSESYLYNLKKYNDKLSIPWEKNCSKELKLKDKDNCIKKIKNIIINDKISVPQIDKFKINIDNGIFVNVCFYTGTSIDIIFGLIYLKNSFNNIKLLLEYPLTINEEIQEKYKKFGLFYKFKLEFSNINIFWCYNEIVFPSYFDHFFKQDLKDYNYIIIPIAIEIPDKSHANILIYDLNKKTVERFEPNGKNYPRDCNYNPNLLDNYLENKFKQIDKNIKYIKPSEYLPIIGFQILEILEENKCKRIGDPNGFCAVWCIWWIEQKLTYPDIESGELARKLIEIIKIKNIKFKNLIRNYSKNITDLRDNYLKKYEIDFNDWLNENYDEELISNLEKDIIQLI